MASWSNTDLCQMLNEALVIHPIRKDSVTPVGYDLTIGLMVNLSTSEDSEDSENSEDSEDSRVFYLPPSTSALILSKERVWLSGKLLATLHSKGSLSAQGLVTNSTTVDPNWTGRLTIRVHNTSGERLRLEENEPFLTMVLHEVRTDTTAEPETNPQTVIGRYNDRYGNSVGAAVFDYENCTRERDDDRKYDKLRKQASVFIEKESDARQKRATQKARRVRVLKGVVVGVVVVALLVVINATIRRYVLGDIGYGALGDWIQVGANLIVIIGFLRNRIGRKIWKWTMR